MEKFTLRDFEKVFPDDDTCLEWLKEYRWPNGITCQNCQRVTKHHRVVSRTSYSCDVCGHHVHPMAGTIYQDSRTSLKMWFYAIFIMAQTRCGISAKQLQREIGVTYKTAWRMFKQIRSMLNESETMLSGEVEVDESYYGGKRRGKRGRGAAGKAVVVGAVERQGRVVVKVVPNAQAGTLVPFVKIRVLPSSTVYTDELASYKALPYHGYAHRRIHHASKVYVSGTVHTNTIEGFWSLTKRGIGGVYHSVSQKYLGTYLNEYAFRYNHRNDAQHLFKTMLGLIPLGASPSEVVGG